MQALQGAGQADACVEVLESLKNHADRDVRVVAKELLYIAAAPKLTLHRYTLDPQQWYSLKCLAITERRLRQVTWNQATSISSHGIEYRSQSHMSSSCHSWLQSTARDVLAMDWYTLIRCT